MKRSNTSVNLAIISVGFILAILTINFIQYHQKVKAETSGDENGIFFPISFNNFDSSLDRPLFGVQRYGNTGSSSKYHQAMMDSKASWLRVAISWESVEPANVSPDQFQFNQPDAILAAAQQGVSNVNIIATIWEAPGWAAPEPHAPIHNWAMPEFAEFVEALVERYDGDGVDDAPGSPVVNYWEFYNEQDTKIDHYNPGWGDDGDKYALMLQTVYDDIKEANPNAQIVFGGIAYDWFEDQNGPFVRRFLDDVIANGGGDYFDIMNFHAYPTFNYNWTNNEGPGLYEKALVIRSKLAQFGYGDKPIIITEAGWHSNNPSPAPSSEEIQARYVVELFTQSMAADIEVMIWWMLYDPGGLAWDNGLVSDDDPVVYKASMTAYQTAVSKLSTAHFDRRLSAAETGGADMEAYKFIDYTHNRTLYVAWMNPVNSTATRTISFPGSIATVRNIYGTGETKTDCGDGQCNGLISVLVGARPVYVEVNP